MFFFLQITITKNSLNVEIRIVSNKIDHPACMIKKHDKRTSVYTPFRKTDSVVGIHMYSRYMRQFRVVKFIIFLLDVYAYKTAAWNRHANNSGLIWYRVKLIFTRQSGRRARWTWHRNTSVRETQLTVMTSHTACHPSLFADSHKQAVEIHKIPTLLFFTDL